MGWVVYLTNLDEKHVVPEGEEHSNTDMCRCKPTFNGDAWVHHSDDRREYTIERQ